MAGLLRKERDAKNEKLRDSRRPAYPRSSPLYDEPISAQSFEFSLEDFGPPLASSPEIASGLTSVASTPPSRSFANIASHYPSSPPSHSWKRNEPIEENVWKLDISKDLIESVINAEPQGKGKKKMKKVLLLGNSGGRGRS
jgi:hypothetical protein